MYSLLLEDMGSWLSSIVSFVSRLGLQEVGSIGTLWMTFDAIVGFEVQGSIWVIKGFWEGQGNVWGFNRSVLAVRMRNSAINVGGGRWSLCTTFM